MAEIFHRPLVSCHMALELANVMFNLQIESESCVEELDSYEDRNFMVCGTIGKGNGKECSSPESNKTKRFVLKVMNARESYSGRCNIDGIDKAMIHMNRKLGTCYSFPMPHQSMNGNLKEFVELPVYPDKIPRNLLEKIKEIKSDQSKSVNLVNLKLSEDNRTTSVLQVHYYVRLLSYVPGDTLSSMKVVTDDHMFQCGKLVARVSKALKDFSHPALMTRNSVWDLKNFRELSDEKYLGEINDVQLRKKIELFFKNFEREVAPLEKRIPKQTLHSDISEQNIIVSIKDGKGEISGLIDFGDLIHSYRLCEITNCMSHIGALRKNEMRDCGIILAGYLSETDLTDEEMHVLFYFVTARIALCYLRGLFELSEPCNVANSYVRGITNDAKESLAKFLARFNDKEQLMQEWTNVC